MEDLLLILQAVTVAFLVLLVLLQKSSADGLAGLAGGGHGVLSGRSSANLLTKLTFLFAAIFMGNSLVLAKINIENARGKGSIVQSIVKEQQQQTKPAAAETKSTPQVPLVE